MDVASDSGGETVSQYHRNTIRPFGIHQNDNVDWSVYLSRK